MCAWRLTSISDFLSSVDQLLGIFPAALKNNFDATRPQVHTDWTV
ncbi:hypothetical protein PSAC2689_100248 [Paraburkholderia sacchari]